MLTSAVDYISTNFGVNSSSRFPFKARTDRRTTQTVTDRTDHITMPQVLSPWIIMQFVSVIYCCAVPDKPLITGVISGENSVIVTWQKTSALAVTANPGYVFYVKYHLTGDFLQLFIILVLLFLQLYGHFMVIFEVELVFRSSPPR